MHKTLGLGLFVLSLLTLSINIMLGLIAYHIDRLDNNFVNELKYIFPNSIYWLIGLSFLISIYLMLHEYLSKSLKKKRN